MVPKAVVAPSSASRPPRAQRLVTAWGLRAIGMLTMIVGLAVSGCDTETDTREPIVRTGMGIDPLDFLGTVPCVEGPGGARAYVATLTDLSTGTVLKSSPPLSCALPVAFEDLEFCEEGQARCNAYRADIDVYNVPPEAITPVSSGSRQTNQTPTWTTKCGPDDALAGGAPRAIPNRRVFVRPCVELEGGGTGTTTLVVPTQSLFDETECETIDAIEVSGIEPALADVTVACGQGPVRYASGITPGIAYTLSVTALDGADVVKTAQCQVVAREGVENVVNCGSFSSTGNIEVDIPALAAASSRTCGVDVAHLDASFTFETSTLTADDASCATRLTLGPARPGAWTGEIRFVSKTGTTVETFACSADVTPGATSAATCQ